MEKELQKTLDDQELKIKQEQIKVRDEFMQYGIMARMVTV